MRIKYLHGHEIEIKDLEQSLRQVENMLNPTVEESPFQSNFIRIQKNYWTDMFNKLLELKEKQNQNQTKAVEKSQELFSRREPRFSKAGKIFGTL